MDSDGKDCGERGVEVTEEGDANSRAASAFTQASVFSIADEQLSSSPVQLCKACSITKTSVSGWGGRLALIYCLSDLAVSQSSLPKPHGF